MKRPPKPWRSNGKTDEPKTSPRTTLAGKNLLVRGLPSDILEKLREQAVRNGRSLEGEARIILERDVAASPAAFLGRLRQIRRSLGTKTLPDSTPLIREDRGR